MLWVNLEIESQRGSWVGEKLQDWIQSPAQIITFGPRVTLGAILAAPERFSQLCSSFLHSKELFLDIEPAILKK